MTRFNKAIYEMLVRVLVFASRYPEFFPKDSQKGQLLDAIETAVRKLSADALSERSGRGAVKTSTGERAEARAALRRQLTAISRTARGLKLGEFWISREQSDRALVEFGQLFVKKAEPLKQTFIDSDMPPDFIEQLNAAVYNLESIIKVQTYGKGTRLAAAAALAQTRNEALAALQRLDPIMANLLRGDRPTLAVWESARRVERSSKPAGAEDATELLSGTTPPVANTAPTTTQS